MITKTITIKDNKALEVLKSLENIEFIEFDKDTKGEFLKSLKPKNKKSSDSLFDLKGIWHLRNLSINEIRVNAWPQRK